jgi:phage tail sheath protein FI
MASGIRGTPGVYIEEFEPAPPIQGVSTSTAAFLGAASKGPLMRPIQLTSWDAFIATFGDRPIQGRYLWYAVRGFFRNGGRVCYVVRVSNAAAARLELLDANGSPTIVVTALTPGTDGNSLSVKLDSAHAVTASVLRHEAAVTLANMNEITVDTADNAARFRPGDIVVLVSDTSRRAAVVAITGNVLRLDRALAPVGADRLRLSDLTHGEGDRVLRLESVTFVGPNATLAAGSVMRIQQPAGAGPTPIPTPTPTPTPTPGPAGAQQFAIVASVVPERIQLSTGPLVTYRVTVADPLQDIDLSTAAGAATVRSEEFKLTLTDSAGATTTFDNLAMDPASPNFYRSRVNPASPLVQLEPTVPPSPSTPPLDIPVDPAAPNLTGGVDEDLDLLLPSDYATALQTLAVLKDIDIVAIPDSQEQAVQMYLLQHCESLADRIAIIDPRLGSPPLGSGSVAEQQGGVTSPRGFAAIYYPWLVVEPATIPGAPPPPVAPPNVLVPPSGHMAGVYARTDLQRGVHKAPAGEEADVRDAVGLERIVGDPDQDILNLTFGVDVIRIFRPHGRPIVWGARTTATGVNSNWQYVSTRRLFLFLEKSILQGIRFAVFEPNDRGLWENLKLSISAFLTSVWRDGALFGASPKEAFYVRIDDALNPPNEMALGRLTIEIGVRPAYPAEFILVRIGIWQGGSAVSES